MFAGIWAIFMLMPQVNSYRLLVHLSAIALTSTIKFAITSMDVRQESLFEISSFGATIHSLPTTVNSCYFQIKSLGAKAGVVLNPGTPLTAIDYVLDGELLL